MATFEEEGKKEPVGYETEPQGFETALVDYQKYGNTRRGLKSRHIQLIAIGGGRLSCILIHSMFESSIRCTMKPLSDCSSSAPLRLNHFLDVSVTSGP